MSALLKNLADGISAEAAKNYDYPKFTRLHAQKDFARYRKELGSLAAEFAAQKRQLADHDAWFKSESIGIEHLGFHRISSMAQERLPAIESLLARSAELKYQATNLAIGVSRLFISVQVILRKPIDGLKTLTDKTIDFQAESGELHKRLQNLNSKLESLLEDTPKWKEIEKNTLLLHSGFQRLGVEGLLSLAYGPGKSSVVRAMSLRALGDWAKKVRNHDLELMFEAHTNVARAASATEPEDAKKLLATVSAELGLTEELSSIEFFGIVNASSPDSDVARANLRFALANAVRKLKPIFPSSELLQLEWINEALKATELTPLRLASKGSTLLDRIEPGASSYDSIPGPKVSVIVPVFNSESWLETALNGLIGQTHKNLEIIVVDDASTDGSLAKARQLSKADERISVFSNSFNQGVYVSRNLGLARATGEFVTVHDADDWSHPSKIALQLRPLVENPALVATTSQAVRINPETLEVQKTQSGDYLRINYSSLMFRRELVVNRIGYWDEVRFGADSEYLSRLLAVFGSDSLEFVETGAASLTRSWEGSLTAGGIDQQLSGARQTYKESFQRWHAENLEQPDRLKILPGQERKFYAPRSTLGEPSPLFNLSALIAGDFSSWAQPADLAVFTRVTELVAPSGIGLVHIPSTEHPTSQPSPDIEALCLKNAFTPTWHLIREFGERLELRAKYLVTTDNSCEAYFDDLPRMTIDSKILAMTNVETSNTDKLSKLIEHFETMFGSLTSIAAGSAFAAKKIAREIGTPIPVTHELAKLIERSGDPTRPEGTRAASIG